MASRILANPSLRTATAASALVRRACAAPRSFQTSARLMETPTAALPAKKPVGAFRGGLFGFLTGAAAAAGGMYFYVMEEYRVSNQLLTEDIYALQSAVQRIEGYVRAMEEKLPTGSRK